MISNKEINKLAIPAILYNITEPLIGLADTAIIGQMSENATFAQGGVGLAAGLISTLIWGFAQMRTALSAIISRHFGSKTIYKIQSLIPQTLLLTLIIGLILSIIFGTFYEKIAFFLFGTIDNLTLKFSNDYFSLRCIGIPIGLLVALFFGIFRGFQNTTWAMYIGVTGGIINIILDFILVIGIDNYIEPLGVKGAAIASVISQIIMLFLCIFVFIKKTPFKLFYSKNINPYFQEMISIFINMFLRTIVLNIVFIISNRFANSYGKFELAAYTIGYNIWIFTSFFIDGYSNAGNALAGKYLGQNDNEKLSRLGNKLLKINIQISLVLVIIYAIFYTKIGKLFNSDSEVIMYFNATFWIVIIAQPFNAIAFTFDGIFKGLGRAVDLRNTLTVATFIVFIPVIYLLDFITPNSFCIWAALSLWMIYRGMSLLLKFKKILAN
mgnify:CR=1 FL=1